MVSIILITHNYGVYIKSCLNSILSNNQSLIGEILIIDDSSTDDTFLKIENYLSNSKIKYFLVNFKSLSKSYNFGIRKSKFDFISKIDADDILEENFLEDYYNELLNNNYDLVYGNLKIVDDQLKLIKIKYQTNELIESKFNYPVGSGTIYNKKIWKKIGGFDERLKYQDDYDFWLKINKIQNIRLGSINKSAYKYRMHNQNMSRSVFKKNLSKIFVFVKNLI